MDLNKDEYEAWLAEPVTQLFLEALAEYAVETKQQFIDNAWAGAYLTVKDQVWIAHLKGRSEAAQWFSELDFDQFKSFFEEE